MADSDDDSGSADLSLKLRRGSSDSRDSFYMEFDQGIDSDIEAVEAAARTAAAGGVAGGGQVGSGDDDLPPPPPPPPPLTEEEEMLPPPPPMEVTIPERPYPSGVHVVHEEEEEEEEEIDVEDRGMEIVGGVGSSIALELPDVPELEEEDEEIEGSRTTVIMGEDQEGNVVLSLALGLPREVIEDGRDREEDSMADAGEGEVDDSRAEYEVEGVLEVEESVDEATEDDQINVDVVEVLKEDGDWETEEEIVLPPVIVDVGNIPDNFVLDLRERVPSFQDDELEVEAEVKQEPEDFNVLVDGLVDSVPPEEFQRDADVEQGIESPSKDILREESVVDEIQRVQSPLKGVQSPPKGLQSPLKEINSPLEDIGSPKKGYQSPLKHVLSPVRDVRGPVGDIESPMKDIDSPKKDLHSSLKDVQSPTKDVQSPTKDVQSPSKDVQNPSKESQSPVRDVQSPSEDAQSPVRVQSPVKDITSPLKDVISPLKDIPSHLKDVPTSPRDIPTSPKDVPSPPMDVTSPLKDVSSPLKYVTSSPKDVISPLKDVQSPLKDVPASPKDVPTSPKDLPSPPKEVTSPLKDVRSPVKDVQSPLKPSPPKDVQSPLQDAKSPLKEPQSPPKYLRRVQSPLRDMQGVQSRLDEMQGMLKEMQRAQSPTDEPPSLPEKVRKVRSPVQDVKKDQIPPRDVQRVQSPTKEVPKAKIPFTEMQRPIEDLKKLRSEPKDVKKVSMPPKDVQKPKSPTEGEGAKVREDEEVTPGPSGSAQSSQVARMPSPASSSSTTTTTSSDSASTPRRQRPGDALTAALSALYGKLLVVMGIAFPMAEVISTYIPPSFYEGFYLYLYIGSMGFLFYMYAMLLRDRAAYSVMSSFMSSDSGGNQTDTEGSSTTERSGNGQPYPHQPPPRHYKKHHGHQDEQSQQAKQQRYRSEPGMQALAQPGGMSGSEVGTATDKEKQKYRRPRRRRSHLSQRTYHYGSFYLRMGAVAFGIGSMIYSGLEFGQYFELERNTKCHNVLLALTPATRMAFIFIQMYFIFLNNEMKVYKHKLLARFGLMHMIGTNLCVWLNVLVQETKHEILTFFNPENNTLGLHSHSSRQHTLAVKFSSGVTASTASLSAVTGGATQALHNEHLPSAHQVHHRVERGLKGPHHIYECRRTNIMGSLVQDASPFLFPCTIEYSLICAAILYVMWKNISRVEMTRCGSSRIGKGVDCHGVGPPGVPGGSMVSSRGKVHITPKRSPHHYSVDCARAHKGLFVGILVLVLTIISLILFFVLIGRPELVGLAVFEVNMCELTLYALSTLATIAGMIRVRELRYDGGRNLELDSILLIVSQTGMFTYSTFTVIGGHFTLERNTALVLATALASLVQTTVQTIFVLDASRRSCATASQIRRKPGREVVTFLLVANLAMWAVNTLEKSRAESHPVQLHFYGLWAWTIITHVSMPLAIFYRFHSTVCLCEIWKRAYKMKPVYM